MTDQRLRLAPGTPRAREARLRIALPFAPLLKEPKRRAAQLSELVYGQRFDVHARQGRWAYGRVRSLLPGSNRVDYVGWVDGRALQEGVAKPTRRVQALGAPVFAKPDLKSHIIMSLPLGSQLSVRAEAGDYLQIGAGAWVHRLHTRLLGEPETDPVIVARRFLGQPYVWGGNGARGLDCSGLVQMALAACGIDAPRDADQQEAALGESVPVTDIAQGGGRSGDLLFWRGHVGWLAAPDRMLHANAHHMSVVDEPLEPALARMARGGTQLQSVKRL